jgi:hypothetical protein
MRNPRNALLRKRAVLGAMLVVLVTAWLSAQMASSAAVPPPDAGQAPEVESQSYCSSLSSGTAETAALASACNFALSLRQTLPNFICDQTTRRYRPRRQPDFHNFRNAFGRHDVIAAHVMYQDGGESYTGIRVNGRPANVEMLELSGMDSTGEFGSLLRSVFDPANLAEFTYVRTKRLNSRRAYLFRFRVAERNNHSWTLYVDGFPYRPGFRGSLWLEQATSRVLRVELGATDFSATFPYSEDRIAVEYADIPLGDGTSFRLPVRSENLACLSSEMRCLQNLIEFKNYHKFRATHRLLTR